MNKNRYALIMAGGVGSRFWPVSRTEFPKQFIDFFGVGKTLIQSTYDRFLNICLPENIFIVTNEIYTDLIKEQLPQSSENQILAEPIMRNTAPCIAYGAMKIAELNPDAVIVVAPSDHTIANQEAFVKAIGNKSGIKRYGTAFVPMDEALLMVSLDLSGRAFLAYDVTVNAPMIGDYDTELTEEFLRAFSYNAGITMHVKMMAGSNSHHIVEGVFKALARALREALTKDDRIQGVMSTKGML